MAPEGQALGAPAGEGAGAAAEGGGGGGGGGGAWRTVQWLEARSGTARTNSYLREALQSRAWALLSGGDPAFRSLANVKSRTLKKEITEAVAAAKAVERLLWKVGSPEARRAAADGEGLAIVDVGAAKGWCSLFLASRFPAARITMVDKDRGLNLEHLAALPNVSFTLLDVYRNDAAAVLRGLFGAAGVQVLLGIHLCGPLSIRAADLFKDELPDCTALVLAPCCLPKQRLPKAPRQDREGFSPVNFAFGLGLCKAAQRLQVCPYQLWATSLLFYFAEFPRKELVADEFVLSSRNRLILVLRGGGAAVPKHAGRKC